MGYEKFSRPRKPSKDQPMITLLKEGQLGINKVCTEKYFQDNKYAELYFDKRQRKVGIRPTDEASADAYYVRPLKGGKLGKISVKEFLKHYDIPHERSIAFPVTWNEEEKLLEITLEPRERGDEDG